MTRKWASALATTAAAAMVITGAAQPASSAGQWRTAYAIDGDTITVGGTSVRLLGYDTPEVGQRCYTQATRKAAALIRNGVKIHHVVGKDRYGRTLAYVKTRSGRDVGSAMLKAGLAIARYDSLDGYDWHPKQNKYRAIDARNGQIRCKNGTGNPQPGVYYANCTEVERAGAAPIRRGDPGYGPHLDRDGDGVACEQ